MSAPALMNTSGSAPAAKVRPRVLVVDDDPVVGCLLADALNRGGFEAEVFQHAPAALEIFESLAADLAVVGCLMPDLGGLTLAGRLKRMAPDLPVMLITGYGDQKAARQALRSGLVDVALEKPFDCASFMRLVSSLVGLPEENEAPPPPRALARAVPGGGAYFEKILDSLIDAVIMIDHQGRVVYHNRGAGRMFGFPGLPDGRLFLSDFCPPENPLNGLFIHFFGGHPPVQEQCEAYFARTGGDRFRAIFSASLFRTGGHGQTVLLVVKDIEDRHSLYERLTEDALSLERLALTDPLTGLSDRRHFDRRLAEEFKRLERYRTQLTVVMIDFDHFKEINDRFGHLTGDKVLRRAADMLTQALREVDTVSRWGGEEYMLLLPETGGATGLSVARRLHEHICDPGQWESLAAGLRVTVSMGLVSLPWRDRSPNSGETLELLDKALYQAKERGRSRIIRYDADKDAFEET